MKSNDKMSFSKLNQNLIFLCSLHYNMYITILLWYSCSVAEAKKKDPNVGKAIVHNWIRTKLQNAGKKQQVKASKVLEEKKIVISTSVPNIATAAPNAVEIQTKNEGIPEAGTSSHSETELNNVVFDSE